MRRLRACAGPARPACSRGRRDRAFAEELESHLQLHIDDNIRAGMTPDEARRRRILKLGGIDRTRRGVPRPQARCPIVEHSVQDLRFALRQLVKAPGFTVTAMLTLALGMGAAVAIYAFVDAALVEPLPYREPYAAGGGHGAHASDPARNLSYAGLSSTGSG